MQQCLWSWRSIETWLYYSHSSGLFLIYVCICFGNGRMESSKRCHEIWNICLPPLLWIIFLKNIEFCIIWNKMKSKDPHSSLILCMVWHDNTCFVIVLAQSCWRILQSYLIHRRLNCILARLILVVHQLNQGFYFVV